MSGAAPYDVAILGAGPGGYVAAIRAAQLGLRTALVDRHEPGGVCLREGCIPSKALLHAAALFHRIKSEAPKIGIQVGEPTMDVAQLQAWKNGVVGQLVDGVGNLLKRHGVDFILGEGSLENAGQLAILSHGEKRVAAFEHLILATGSRETPLSVLPYGKPNIWSPRDALNFDKVPASLAVIGGGVIGLELGQLFARLGSKVTIYEAMDEILPGRDRRVVDFLKKRMTAEGVAFKLSFRIDEKTKFDEEKILVAVGRRPLSANLGLEKVNLQPDERGFIGVNAWLQTDVPNIYAIGDLVKGPLLAHRASRMGIAAIHNIAGTKTPFDVRAMPSVVYTDPEIAWVGMSEAEAKEKNIPVKVGRFPFQASGRALAMNEGEGSVALISSAVDGRILGCEAVGPEVENLIAEVSLAIEMGATAEDLALTTHPHPTLSEALHEAAESVLSTAIHIYQKPVKS